MIDNWRKATYSADNSSCVETGWTGDTVGYRDTKQAALPDAERPVLVFGKAAARALLDMITR
ncbi:MAG TPA: DUF397 domain-containing protein [Pseudonocardiaceae bacterium]|nr:DUF397 domain-containing protein [Pseudonocardiaceae bacterium]